MTTYCDDKMENSTFDQELDKARQDALIFGDGFLQISRGFDGYHYRKIDPLDVMLVNKTFDKRKTLPVILKDDLVVKKSHP